ncbi:MAG TPA: family 1 glycosylhydrolase [Pirellulaceae bacterium]|jgi:dTDP-4-dehydrorhamnose reductase|nr:family 1 glycosylhydrolase [Pirellulaceae bacterium]
MESSIAGPLEMWAGLECSVNRVGSRYFDQFQRTRHDERLDDLDRIASLGVRTIRYLVSWERHQADPSRWGWTDERLARLRDLGIRPIVGLVHHGSGPPDTSLLDPAFPERLAAFAETVARRYPWIDAYTPVNEPLTTARFSALYGLWYPHCRDDRSFIQALLTELKATTLAMQAIRRVRPDAMLVQTEDLGRTHAPPRLRYQADFENERRWLSWDLLSGEVPRRGPVARYLRKHETEQSDLRWFAENPCPPDLLGVNYYVTSERFLDDRLNLYPRSLRGGNRRHRYVDTEAVRVLEEGASGPSELLPQAWERYRRPIAVTEAHLGCTREEQLRWLLDVWRAAKGLRAGGIDIRAVTAWSVFGAYDWDSLITRDLGSYEPGAFDVRSDPPRPTAISGLIRSLANGEDPQGPEFDAQGWWLRPDRLTAPPVRLRSKPDELSLRPPAQEVRDSALPERKLLILGEGSLARSFEAACRIRALAHARLTRAELDPCDAVAVEKTLARHRPWAVVNASGFHRIEASEADPALCRRENVSGPVTLAAACAALKIPFVTFSTDMVFDGLLERPYREFDQVAPLNQYGRCHAEAEKLVTSVCSSALVVRTGALFGPLDGEDFVSRMLRTLRGGHAFAAPEDIVTSPSYRPDVVHAALDLLIDGETGVCHLSGPEPMSWAELAKRCAQRAQLDVSAVQGRAATDAGWHAPRPQRTALVSERYFALPTVDAGLDRCLATFLG